MTTQKQIVRVDGREMALSNLDKVLYPAAKFTKARILDYYAKIAPALLPHLAGRPLTLKRYPEGVTKPFFYEKECPRYRPSWMRTCRSGATKEHVVHYCVVEDRAGLLWVANLASIELHTMLSRAGDPTRPTMVVFDFDPGPPATILDCVAAAERLKKILAGLGLESFPKTSGGKGLHVAIPLNTRTTYERTKAFARAMAERLERETPEKVTSNMKKSLRPGKVFVDWSQNTEHKTTVCAYSLRAMARPTVSTPVTWEELRKAAAKKNPAALVFESDAVLARVKKLGDLHAPVEKLKQRLP